MGVKCCKAHDVLDTPRIHFEYDLDEEFNNALGALNLEKEGENYQPITRKRTSFTRPARPFETREGQRAAETTAVAAEATDTEEGCVAGEPDTAQANRARESFSLSSFSAFVESSPLFATPKEFWTLSEEEILKYFDEDDVTAKRALEKRTPEDAVHKMQEEIRRRSRILLSDIEHKRLSVAFSDFPSTISSLSSLSSLQD